jgi:hypothetical protein
MGALGGFVLLGSVVEAIVRDARGLGVNSSVRRAFA